MRSRTVRLQLLAVLIAVASLPVVALPAAASGAAPTVALVAPAAGASGVAAPATLQVRPADLDDASLDVTFHAQARTAGTPNPSVPFTFGVIPDTQNYVSTSALTSTMGTQTQWLVDHRSDLNLAFVTHLGDIVGVDTSTVQWDRASQYMATLDAAGVPNTVLPGNHDMNLSTGAAPLYQQYFPPSRYASAGWNSPTASYGGYLGQNQFGPDPVNRQNMDNYALFTAGGMDFLLLNLEFNAPDYAVDWAKKVLAAYPDRRAILATHSYVHLLGNLTTQVSRTDGGGNSGLALFNKLVSPSCSIFLVVNGHFSDSVTAENRRTDTNSCGQRVDSILTDYQDRANGGDGWLRYYTFVPSANEIRAYTYSPTLGQFETDADSQFVLSYDMAVPPEMPTVGTGTVASGAVATAPGPNVPAGTTVDWYATVSDGTSTTRSQTWSYTTAPAGPTVLAADSFNRSVTAGWGTADTGGPWALVGGNTRFAAGDGAGKHVLEPGRTVSSALGQLASTAVDLQSTVSLDRLSGDAYFTVSGRIVGSADYGARVKVLSNGLVQLHTERSGTLLAGGTVAGLTAVAGQKLKVRVQVDGISPSTVRAKVWKDGNAEPASWQYTSTDSTAGLQTAGGIRLQTYISSTATGGLMTARWDDLQVTSIGGTTPPPNQAPTASFSASSVGLTASVDSAASTDADGTIVQRAWTFGDGGTATGSTATHPYTSAGTYTITLTVTDDDGAVGTTTRQVSVTAPPPNQPPVASFTSTTSNLTANVDSAGSTDSDGTITSRTWDFGDGGTASGATASHPYAVAGAYPVTLTVTDDDGAQTSVTKTVTVTAPQGPTVLAADAFGRTSSNGWGAADSGGSWTVAGTPSRYSVGAGTGVTQVPAGVIVSSTLAGVSSVSTDITTVISLDALANNTVYSTVSGRLIGAADYGAQVKLYANGATQLYLERSGTTLVGGTLPGITTTAGSKLTVRVQVQGSSPTTIRAKAWPTGTAEPASWRYTITDSTAGLQAAGAVRLATYLSSAATSGPVNVRWDDLAVTPAG